MSVASMLTPLSTTEWLCSLAVTVVYSVSFVFLRFYFMPQFKSYNAMPERHQVEWIMRLVATFNGTVCGLIGLYALVVFTPEALEHARIIVVVVSGYFVYDTIGNVLYYPLLRKSYILFHHVFSWLSGISVCTGNLLPVAAMGGWCLLPDPVDHVLWFFHRLGYRPVLRKRAARANTIFYIVNRVLVAGPAQTYFIWTWPSMQVHTWLRAWLMLLNFVFLVMNLRVSMQRLYKKPHPTAPSPVPSPVPPSRSLPRA